MLVTTLIKLCKLEHRKIPPPDLIAALSYGTLQHRLAHATEQIIGEAAQLARHYPAATLSFSNAAHSFTGGAQLESTRKHRLLRRLAIASERIVEGGAMTNSLQEVRAILAALRAAEHPTPKTVLVVTGEIHSRRAAHIWRTALPRARVFVRCVDTRFECEPAHPMVIQRSPWLLFSVNVLHYALLALPGGAQLTERLRHPSSQR